MYSPHSWTEKEVEHVRVHYNGKRTTTECIANYVGHSVEAVKHKAYQLGLGKSHPRFWKEDEIEKLVETVGSCGVRKAVAVLNRSENSISLKLNALKISSRIRNDYFTLTETARILGVCDQWVRDRIKEKRLKAHPVNGHIPKTGGAWYTIKENDLKQFIIENATLLCGRNVDLSTFVYLFTTGS